jgi:hypothetical protein
MAKRRSGNVMQRQNFMLAQIIAEKAGHAT